MSNRDKLIIHVLDVGHGDSIVIEFPNSNSFGIVDCNRHQASNRGFGVSHDRRSTKLLAFFQKCLANRRQPVIEFVCVSHPHADHYTGLAETLERLIALKIPIKEFWDYGVSAKKAKAMIRFAGSPDQRSRALELGRLCDVQLRLHKQFDCDLQILASPKDGFWSKHGVEIDVLAPHPEEYVTYLGFLECRSQEERNLFASRYGRPIDANLVCSGLRLRYQDCTIMLGADMGNVSWRKVLSRARRNGDNSLRCETLKVSHHGSPEGCFPEPDIPLWRFLRPQKGNLKSVISGGYRHGLPAIRTMRSLQECGCEVYCTGAMADAVPYTPPGLDGEDLRAFVGEMLELKESTDAGHGNITINCTSAGEISLVPEMPAFDPFANIWGDAKNR